jgi:hypothetical protein
MAVINVSLRVVGSTLAEIETRATAAADGFFGNTPYTSTLTYVQADQDEYDTGGLPLRYLGDVQATSTE